MLRWLTFASLVILACDSGSEVRAPSNTSPSAVRLVEPDSAAIDVARNPVLHWLGGGDIDCDSVTFDVYLGTSEPLSLIGVATGTGFTVTPSLLPASGYTWRIVAKDAHGATSESPTWPFTTAPNYGLRYDGVDDTIRPAACLPISKDASFTLEAWILRRPGGDVWQEIGDSRGFSLYISSSGIYLNLASPGQSAPPQCCYQGSFATYTRYRSTAPVPIGTWTHIAIVWDIVQPVAYINGTADPMAYDITQDSFTCCDFGDPSACFTPDVPLITLDEIRVWNLARTVEDILGTMSTELAGNEPDLLGYWPMNEGSGQIIADHAGGNTFQSGTSADPDVHDPSWVITDWLTPPAATTE